MNGSRFFQRHKALTLFLIFVIALVLRLLVCAQLSEISSVTHPNVQTDMATYARLAREIFQGQWPDHFDYQPFYYTVFLPFCRMLGGDSVWPVLIFQSLLGAAAVWLTGLASSRLFGWKAGILSAVLLALSQMHVFYTPFQLFEVLQSFWMALLLVAAMLCWHRNRPWQWLLFFLLLAAATLTRGNALLLLPGALALLVCRNWRENRRRAILLALACLVLFQLPQLPYAIRNYRYAGRWCGASTAGEKVLALGNTPEAPPGGLEYPLTYHRWVGDSEKRPEEGRVSVTSRILSWAVHEPMQFIELKFRSLLLFWDKLEIPNNVSLDYEGVHSAIIRSSVLLPFTILGTFAIIGLFIAARRAYPRNGRLGYRAVDIFILLGMVLVSWFSTALFYNLARFRVPALPLLCTAGGAVQLAFVRMRRTLRATTDRKQRMAIIRSSFFALLLAALVVSCVFSAYQTVVEPSFMRVFRPNGVQVSFPDTMLLYDHGPFTVGGFTYMPVPKEGLGVVKRLVIPKNAPQKPAVARIPVYFDKKQPGRIDAKLEVNEVSYPLALKQERMMTWLEATIPGVKPDKDGIAEFIWIFHPGNDLYLGLDSFRDYHRSDFINIKGEFLSLKSEAAMELQFQ